MSACLQLRKANTKNLRIARIRLILIEYGSAIRLAWVQLQIPNPLLESRDLLLKDSGDRLVQQRSAKRGEMLRTHIYMTYRSV